MNHAWNQQLKIIKYFTKLLNAKQTGEQKIENR